MSARACAHARHPTAATHPRAPGAS
jgi:hypothetical protein